MRFNPFSLLIAIIALICTVAITTIPSCQPEGFTPEQLQQFAQQQEIFQKQFDELQQQAEQLTAQMAKAGIVDPNTVAKIAKINKETDKVQKQIDLIAQAVGSVQLTGDQQQDFIAMLQAANAASAGFNPYAPIIGGSLIVLSLVLIWLAKRKAAEAATANTALEEVVKGGQYFKESTSNKAAEEFRIAQDRSQSVETKRKVAAIRAV